jgi:hypothetical protein
VGLWCPAGSVHHGGHSGMAGVFVIHAGMVSGNVLLMAVVLPRMGTPALTA